VLHGSSGLTDECVKECVKRGICKVNFATELRIAFTNAVKTCMMDNNSIIDPKKFLAPAREAVREQVMKRIAILNT
jgi:tagatose 1,6-diphosphate aldolase GatY/KbaY